MATNVDDVMPPGWQALAAEATVRRAFVPTDGFFGSPNNSFTVDALKRTHPRIFGRFYRRKSKGWRRHMRKHKSLVMPLTA